MKRLLIALVIVALIFSPRIFWSMKDSKQLTIEIIDKTVPKKDYREHNGLFQVLDYEKVVDSSGELYDIGKDYFGFDPYDKVSGEQYHSDSVPDLIYVTDTYGVYSDDLEENPSGKRSELLDGGITLLEWNAVMASKTEQTTLIAEFNSFASPTEASVSTIMQKNLGVHWDGWIGRYFSDFENEEVPDWLIEEYEEQYGEKWNFKNDGLAFVHNEGKIVVLDDTASKGLVQATPTKEGKKEFPSLRSAPYLYWFDIIEVNEGSNELARYSFDLTDKGESLCYKMLVFQQNSQQSFITRPPKLIISQVIMQTLKRGHSQSGKDSRKCILISPLISQNFIGKSISLYSQTSSTKLMMRKRGEFNGKSKE